MAGNKNSGRREATLSDGQVKALRRGLNLATADGLREWVHRVSEACLLGKVNPTRAKASISAAGVQRGLLIEAEVDRRVKKILDARDEIRKARGLSTSGAVRDVGPPPDGFEEGLKKN